MLASFNMSDERAIIGGYKSQGLKDADAIYSQKQMLIKTFKITKVFAWFSIVIGLPLLIFIIPGILFIGIGIFMLLRANKKIKLIEQATETYCREIGVQPV